MTISLVLVAIFDCHMDISSASATEPHQTRPTLGKGRLGTHSRSHSLSFLNEQMDDVISVSFLFWVLLLFICILV